MTVVADTPSWPADIAVGPLPQLGGVPRRELLVVSGVHECRGEPLPHRRVGDREQQRAGAAGLLHEYLQVVRRHGSVAHPSPIGPSALDRPELGGVGGVGATASDRDRGEVAAVLGIGHPAHLHRQPAGRERHLQVVQGGAAAEDQVAAVRVGGDEMPVPVGVQLDGVGTGPPAPGLGVVDRWRA